MAGRRLLLRSPKDTFEVASPEDTVARNLIALNSGNLVFLGASQKLLGVPGVELAIDGLRIDPAVADEINERYDAYVIPLANAFRPRYEEQLARLTRLIRRLSIPVTILGVGVDGTIDGDTTRIDPMAGGIREFVAAVLDRGPSIGVRGEITADFVRRLGFRDVEVIGCPSMFLDGPHLTVSSPGQALAPDDPIVITISPYVQAMGPLLRHNLARHPNLTYVAQDIETLEMLVFGTAVEGATPGDPIPRHPDHPLVRDSRTRQYIDPWPWIADLRSAAFVFGSRIHGTIAGLLAGTPSYVLAHDARTVELARYFEIPHRALRDVPPDTDASELYAASDPEPMVAGHARRFERLAGYLAAHGLEHVFDHSGAAEAFDRRVAGTAFPAAVTWASGGGRVGVRGAVARARVHARRFLRRDDVRQLRRRISRRMSRRRAAGER